jgi:hypothetical protein
MLSLAGLRWARLGRAGDGGLGAENCIDDLQNALLSGGQQVCVDPQGDRRVVVTEVLRQGPDVDAREVGTAGQQRAGVVRR